MHWSNELDWPQWWCPQLFVFRWCLGRIAQYSASCRQPCRTEWIKNVLGNHFLKRNKLCMIWWVVSTTTTILKNLAGGIVDDGVKAREGCACGICDVAGFRVSFLRKNFHWYARRWTNQSSGWGNDEDKEENLHGGHQAVSPKTGTFTSILYPSHSIESKWRLQNRFHGYHSCCLWRSDSSVQAG